MKGIFNYINITGLHGNPNKIISAKIRDNTLIIIGENGSGKTTFLRILFYLLSGKWLSLLQFNFTNIEISIDDFQFWVTKEELRRSAQKIDHRILLSFPPSVRRHVTRLIETGQADRIPSELEKLGFHLSIPTDLLLDEQDLFDAPNTPRLLSARIREKMNRLHDLLNAQVLYLPTFRRIERELGSIFEGLDSAELRKKQSLARTKETDDAFIELVEFGMQDVQKAVERTLENIKEFARQNLNNLTLKYLGDVVNEEYKKVEPSDIANVSVETIRAVLDRIDESILTQLHKEHLFAAINRARTAGTPSEHDQIVCHYFLKLRSFQEALQEKEKSISAFCALCSAYMKDKKFIYDRSTFRFAIIPRNEEDQGQQIDFSELSSGEKQIVSLFSHIHLSGKRRYFVLIDEPELSLSVPWQKRFLSDIRKGEFCSGLIAVTHSPFIYDNNLHPYAHSLGELSNF